MIAYKDANIDVYMPSGEVINVPAIKDVVLHKVKTINDITFAPGKVYVATSFGYLVLDDTTFDVNERARLAVQMQQELLDDNSYVFCSFLRMSMICKAEVSGLEAHACDFYELTADLDIK